MVVGVTVLSAPALLDAKSKTWTPCCGMSRSIPARVFERALGVGHAGGPVLEHRGARELVVLGLAFVVLAAIDEVDHRDGGLGRQGGQRLRVGVFAQARRQLRHAAAWRLQRRLPAQLEAGVQARPAGKADVLLALGRLGQGRRHLAARREQVDLEDQAAPPPRLVEHVLQRRVGDDAAVPVELAVDLDRREARRQGAAGHDVARIEATGIAGVEVPEVAVPDVDRADRETHASRIEEVEIDQRFQRLLQRLGVVVADRAQRAGRLEWCGRNARHEEPLDAEQHGDRRVGLVDRVAGAVDPVQLRRQRRRRERKRRHLLPEFAQPGNAPLRRVAGDQRRVDGADRDARHPVRHLVHRRQRFEHAGLVGAERAAALQDEDAFLLRVAAVAALRGRAAGAGRVQWRQLSSARSRRRSRPGQTQRAAGAARHGLATWACRRRR